MFPLKTKKTIGYGYGAKTFYSTHHLGQDYSAKIGNKLFAPFDGKIISQLNGAQGGLTIWFQAEGSTDIIRFMHLSKFSAKVGRVKEGDLIALTGNTGSATTGTHLHIDISKKKVVISDWTNFKDPEKYKWEVKKVQSDTSYIKTQSSAVLEPIKTSEEVIKDSIGIYNADLSETLEEIKKIKFPKVTFPETYVKLDELPKIESTIWQKIANFLNLNL